MVRSDTRFHSASPAIVTPLRRPVAGSTSHTKQCTNAVSSGFSSSSRAASASPSRRAAGSGHGPAGSGHEPPRPLLRGSVNQRRISHWSGGGDTRLAARARVPPTRQRAVGRDSSGPTPQGVAVGRERDAWAWRHARRAGASHRTADESAGHAGDLGLGPEHVAVGRLDGGDAVAEQLGHVVDRRAGLEQVGGVGVPEAVGVGAGGGRGRSTCRKLSTGWGPPSGPVNTTPGQSPDQSRPGPAVRQPASCASP